MLRALDGRPLPPSGVVKLLQEIDERFGMVFIPKSDLWPVGCWSVTLRWLQADPRRQMIRDGRMALGTDYDCFCYLPEDCPPEQAPGYIRQACIRWMGTKQEAHHYLDKLNKYNQGVEQSVKNKELEYVDELISTNVGTLFNAQGKRIPKVYVTDYGPRKRKGRPV